MHERRNRGEYIRVMLTAGEKAKIFKMARDEGMTISKYVRKTLLKEDTDNDRSGVQKG